ncbi:MAG: restriction endonuclease subunit S, partial [Candidatus Melainabacteria bacterium]
MQFEYHTFLSLSSKIIDNRGKTCPTSSVGIPLIATNCVKNDTLYPSYEKVRYISQETYSNWFRGHPEPGDLIFVTKGSPGQVCLAPDPVDFCIAQDMVAFRVDEKKVNSRYLFAVLRSPSIQTKIENMHVGTLIPHFKKGDFDKLDIPIPKPEYQKLIGDYFYYLSLKIELNRRMNETLEAMAKALFKSWFVDFDPIRAKAEGRQPEGLAPEIADLFPDGFEDSELGEIPRGWEVKTLGIISNYLKRGISPKYVEEGGVCVINQKCIRNGWLDISKARRHNSELRSVEGREIEIGDILVNSTGVGTLGRVAQVLDMPETMIVDSHVTIVRPNPETIKP